MKYNIFISCKSEDYAKAESIYYWLTEKGYTPFFAPISLKISKIHGEPVVFGDEIDAALEEAENMILFTSKAVYVTTGYVRDEWRTFVEEQRAGRKSGFLVTILDSVDIADLPIRLRSVQSFTPSNYKEGILRFFGNPPTSEETIGNRDEDKNKKIALAEIIEGVKSYVEKRGANNSRLSPIDEKYKENGYTIVGVGKSTILLEDVEAISDDMDFIKISESVIAIEKEAFNYSHSQLIVIPETVRTIGENAFNYVHNIMYYGNASGKPWGALHSNVYIEGDFIYSDKNKKEITGYIGNDSMVTIPRKVETIGSHAFHYFCDLKFVIIPNTVTSIEESAFDGCANLEEVRFSDSLKYIGWAAFRLCKSLKSIVIPKSIRTIEECAFYGCDNLRTVYLGNPNAIFSTGDWSSFPEHTKITIR